MDTVARVVELTRAARYREALALWTSLGGAHQRNPTMLELGAALHEQLQHPVDAAEAGRRRAARPGVHARVPALGHHAGPADPPVPPPDPDARRGRSGDGALRAHFAGTPVRYPECLDLLTDADWHGLRDAYFRSVDALRLPSHQVLVDKLPLNLVRLDFLARLFPRARLLQFTDLQASAGPTPR